MRAVAAYGIEVPRWKYDPSSTHSFCGEAAIDRHTLRTRAQRAFSAYISMPRIALVDNEIELRKEVATFLRSHGHQVTELDSCAELRGSVATAVSDILVVDRTLPDGDGLHVVGELMQKHREMGVIMFTARGTQSERLDGLRQGVDHYLNKSVPLEERKRSIDPTPCTIPCFRS